MSDAPTYMEHAARSNRKIIQPHRVVTLAERGIRRDGSPPDEAVTPIFGEASRTTTPAAPSRKPRRRHSTKVKAVSTTVETNEPAVAA
jgi:hypothetical protein